MTPSPPATRQVALTFDAEVGDDLPGHNIGAAGWTQVLDVLDRHNITATFFLQADWAAKNPALARRTRDAGHLLGNHTLNHLNLADHPEQLADQVTTSNNVIGAVLDTDVHPWFRLPYFAGNDNDAILAELDTLGWEHIDRHCDSQDWNPRSTTPDVVAANVFAHADAQPPESPLIMLFHTWPPHSAAAVELIITRLGAAAEYVTVAEIEQHQRDTARPPLPATSLT